MIWKETLNKIYLQIKQGLIHSHHLFLKKMNIITIKDHNINKMNIMLMGTKIIEIFSFKIKIILNNTTIKHNLMINLEFNNQIGNLNHHNLCQ